MVVRDGRHLPKDRCVEFAARSIGLRIVRISPRPLRPNRHHHQHHDYHRTPNHPTMKDHLVHVAAETTSLDGVPTTTTTATLTTDEPHQDDATMTTMDAVLTSLLWSGMAS